MKKLKSKRETDEVGDARGDRVGGDGSVAGSNNESVRIRVSGVSGSPGGSENGSRLNLPFLQYAFPVTIFVPICSVFLHCYTSQATCASSSTSATTTSHSSSSSSSFDAPRLDYT